MGWQHTIDSVSYVFPDLATLLARISLLRSGDCLAGLAAATAVERMAARLCLADLPLRELVARPIIPYETDEVTRLICDGHDAARFATLAHLTVGGSRDWLLDTRTDEAALAAIAPAVTPELAAAVSKLMRNQDLVLVARKCRVVARFRGTLGLPGWLAVRLQPNHPTDDTRGIAAAVLDGLMYGAGDAEIGINPATDSPARLHELWRLVDGLVRCFEIPTQSRVLAHVTSQIRAIESIAGTEAANRAFGVSLAVLDEARDAALSLHRGTCGDNVMYFETG
jgi:ethanolamine ammonia-lyase large subunit